MTTLSRSERKSLAVHLAIATRLRADPALREVARARTVRFENAATSGAVGLCMEPHDLAASKLCAGREKDLEFVAGAIAAGLVDLALLERRLGEVDADERVLKLARARPADRDRPGCRRHEPAPKIIDRRGRSSMVEL